MPTWLEADEAECRLLNPTTKGISYIDTVYVLSYVNYLTFMSDAASQLQLIISTYLNIDDSDVEVWKVKDVTDTFESDAMGVEDPKTAVWVRVTVSDDVASDMLQLMVNSLDRVLSDLKQYTTNVVESRTVITFYSVPELHQYTEYGRVSGWVIFILVVVVLIIIALVSFFLWTRLKNKKTKNGAKKLKAASTAKKDKAQKDSKKARV